MSKYIDSEAFFKAINTLPYKDTSYPDASAYNGAISDVADMLTHFPAADVAEVRRGRWKPHPTEREWDVCSVCGVGTKRREYGLQDGREWVTELNFPYCPNCGAKMDGDTFCTEENCEIFQRDLNCDRCNR